ncbi:hypothetical protein ACF3N7_05375 [Cruoricaptor ignavus]|uniref:hypothetical protein n=1 Tax=Cruoricaptor ignavus TaxID=1118202 RepID=UPI00370D04D1
MAYTTEELKTRLYRYLASETDVSSRISGGIYKDRRPYGSNLEDIVINSLPADARYLQTGVLNVNCYVPYMRTKAVEEKVINGRRAGEIAKMLLPVLEDIWTEMFNTSVEYHNLIDDSDECFYHFRIKLKAFNKQ